MDEEGVRQLLSEYGEVEEVRVPKKIDGKPKGLAIVRFVERKSAIEAIAGTFRRQVEGRELYSNCSKNDPDLFKEFKEAHPEVDINPETPSKRKKAIRGRPFDRQNYRDRQYDDRRYGRDDATERHYDHYYRDRDDRRYDPRDRYDRYDYPPRYDERRRDYGREYERYDDRRRDYDRYEESYSRRDNPRDDPRDYRRSPPPLPPREDPPRY